MEEAAVLEKHSPQGVEKSRHPVVKGSFHSSL